MLSLFTGPVWKLATIGAGVCSIILSIMLFVTYRETVTLNNQKTELNHQIQDPITGYIAKLTTAENNVAVLKAQVARQNLAYKTLSDDDAAKLAETTKQLAVAEAQTKAMTLRLNKFLATAPQGATLDAQIRDIDSRALSELVH